MNELDIKRLGFLKDTLEYYTSVNRGFNGTSCSYVNGCAIGRHLDMDLRNELDNIGTLRSEKAYNLLPVSLSEMGREFLLYVQRLHDDCSIWDVSGYIGGLNRLLTPIEEYDYKDNYFMSEDFMLGVIEYYDKSYR